MKIPKNQAHLAVEATARRLLDHMEGSGDERQVVLDQSDTGTTRAALEAFLEGAEGRNAHAGVQYEEIEARLGELHQELKSVDQNNDGIDASERAQMSKAGQAAMALATQLMAQEPVAAMSAQRLDGLSPEDTMAVVRQAASDHVDLGYNVARAIMFAHIDNEDGNVQGIYEGRELDDLVGLPNARQMNTEHAWPKSRGVKHTPAVSDLHHLFPADQTINNRRASYPFGIVEKARWEQGEAKLGIGQEGHIVFEPPPEQRGDIARALFYVASVYDLPMIEGEPETLLRWHKEDPADPQEQQRNREISRFQRTRNPFVDHPDLAANIVKAIKTQPPPDHMTPEN
jgi:endonuclease I